MRVPPLYLETRFRARFGTDVWRSPEYPTADRIIPFGLFFLYFREIPALEAMERVNTSIALKIAIDRAFAKEGDSEHPMLVADFETAYLEPPARSA